MRPIIVKGATPPKKKERPDKPEELAKPATPKQKGIFKRIADIVADDVYFYIHGIRSKDRDKWEDYKKFCELSRRKS